MSDLSTMLRKMSREQFGQILIEEDFLRSLFPEFLRFEETNSKTIEINVINCYNVSEVKL